MRYWEINGNLNDAANGLANYKLFVNVVTEVKVLFDNIFGVECMNKIRFFVDNAISEGKSGYTPNCTPVFREFVIIKLCFRDNNQAANIAYQFAHELMHVVFYSHLGLNKPLADAEEESICSAASLLTLKRLYPDKLDWYVEHLKNDNVKVEYANGVTVAESVGYEWYSLKKLAEDVISRKKGTASNGD